MSRIYTFSPPKRLHGVQRDWFTFFLRFLRFLPIKIISFRVVMYQSIRNTGLRFDLLLGVRDLSQSYRRLALPPNIPLALIH
jgi:hypothetical protein